MRTIQAVAGTALTDGKTFTLSDGIPSLGAPNVPNTPTYHSFTFEFRSDGSLAGAILPDGNFAVSFTANSTAAQVAQAIRDAIAVVAAQRGLRLSAAAADTTVALQASPAGVPGTLIGFNPGTSALTRLNPTGAYELQVRLRQLYEIPGSIVSHALVAYATNGIQVLGMPTNSPLLGDTALDPLGDNVGVAGQTTTLNAPQPIGNLLASNQEVLTLAGDLSGHTDVNFYEFGLDVQNVNGYTDASTQAWPLQFDMNYADGLARPETAMYVYNTSGQLLYIGGSHYGYNSGGGIIYTTGGSNIADDQQAPNGGSTLNKLASGSYGTTDPSIGTVYLKEGPGIFYDVAVTTLGSVPNPLLQYFANKQANPAFQPLLRVEPVDSLQRVVEDHVGSQNGSNIAQPATYTMFGTPTDQSVVTVNASADPFSLGDVTLYVGGGKDLYTVDPFTGAQETNVDNPWNSANGALWPNDRNQGYTYNDFAMRNDGHLVSVQSNTINTGAYANFAEFNTGNATTVNASQAVTINAGEDDPNSAQRPQGSPITVYTQARNVPYGAWNMQALAYDPTTGGRSYVLAVANMNRQPFDANPGPGVPLPYRNLLYVLDSNGNAVQGYDLETGNPATTGPRNISDIVPFGDLSVDDQGSKVGEITGLAAIGNNIYVVARDYTYYDPATQTTVTIPGGVYQLNGVDLRPPQPFWNWGFYAEDKAVYIVGQTQTQLAKTIVPSGFGPTLTLVGNVYYGGQPIAFSGLARGPQNVENGKFANMLFTTDSGNPANPIDPYGHIYAFTVGGGGNLPLQPIFLDAQTRVSTRGITNPQGLAFSPIDYNLWHVTNRRGGDAGHGINNTDTTDASRYTSDTSKQYAGGGTSFYFGLEDPRPNTTISNQPGASNFISQSSGVFQTYDLPGGAYGSLTTNSFSLAGYDPYDLPTLYFNYFADDQGGLDSFRAFISTGSLSGTSEWQQVSFASSLTTAAGWRQARIDLTYFAGYPNIRLRFDFSTAGEMEVGLCRDSGAVLGLGTNLLTGTILQAIPGDQLRDGNYFMVSDPSWNPEHVGTPGGVPFEFDMGYAVVMPNVAGKAIPDRETIGILDRT